MFFTENNILNEGINDRFYGTYKANQNIVTDIKVDNILNNTPTDKIWFDSDWHLWKYNKETKEVYKNKNADKMISNQNKIVSEDDVFIFLGDLVDDECQNYDLLAEYLDGKINGYKILILGNNDLQPEEYYLNKLGFNEVFQAYQWGKFTFSHVPMKKFNSNYNIHGHLHEHKKDGYDYDDVIYDTRYIKIYTEENNYKPINLNQIVEKYNKNFYNYTK